MHRIVNWSIAAVVTLSLSACGNPIGPDSVTRGRPSVAVERSRRPPTGPITVPDSVGIPPSIPPIYEELPPGLDVAQ